MYEHLDALEACIGRPITRLYPPHSFEWYMFEFPRRCGDHGQGWPHPKARWCSHGKVDQMNAQYRHSTLCLGYEFSERRRRYPSGENRLEQKFDIIPRYPLLEYGVHKVEALAYCKAQGFDFGGLYSVFSRVSCWCCPLRPPSALRQLRDHFPDLWQKMLEMDERSPYPFPRGIKLREL